MVTMGQDRVSLADAVDLELRLAKPEMAMHNGKEWLATEAQLVLLPSDQDPGTSSEPFLCKVPLDSIVTEELSWYLRHVTQWPWGAWLQKKPPIELKLQKYGSILFEAALGHKNALPTCLTWMQTKKKALHRLTVVVESAQKHSVATARLLSLPWELLHQEGQFLLREGYAIRRCLRNGHSPPTLNLHPPLRVLLITPRPDDKWVEFIDHRITARPMAKALKALVDHVEWTLLDPPTFPAMQKALLMAQNQAMPFHVIHFDGYGIFHATTQTGGLCFENPRDMEKWSGRGSVIVKAMELATEMVKHQIPMVILGARQSPQSDGDPITSIVGTLLEAGVASVVAMHQSMTENSLHYFMHGMYSALAAGASIGDAMLAGQTIESHQIHTPQEETYSINNTIHYTNPVDTSQMRDWFVPMLYQGSTNPPLLSVLSEDQTRHVAAKGRFVSMPPRPHHNFIGRSRELLAVERLLKQKPYAVVEGREGAGKTALAVECASWLVGVHHYRRAIYVNLEKQGHAALFLDYLSKQLMPFREGESNSWFMVERVLEEGPTLLILDNVEAVLPIHHRTNGGMCEPESWKKLSGMFKKMLVVEGTKILLISREQIGEPFSGNQVELGPMLPEEASALLAEVLRSQGATPKIDDQGEHEQEIKALVDAVNGHARSLVSLVPEVKNNGVRKTTEEMNTLMARLAEKFPGRREPLYGSVEISLRHLTPLARDKIRVLGLFQGGANLAVLAPMLQLDQDAISSFIAELTMNGLAVLEEEVHLRFYSTLGPYLEAELSNEQREPLVALWHQGIRRLVKYLHQLFSVNPQLAATLTQLESANFLAALDVAQARLAPQEIVAFASNLEHLLARMDCPAALARIVAVRNKATLGMSAWGMELFEAERVAVERLLAEKKQAVALERASHLLEKSLAEGEKKYPTAAYDCANAHLLLGRVLHADKQLHASLVHLEEAHRRFKALGVSGQRMASVAMTKKGDCLKSLGQLHAAAEAYVIRIQEAKEMKDFRGVSVGQFQLGTIYRMQSKNQEALRAFHAAREIFTTLNEPLSVASTWDQIGIAHRSVGEYQQAEAAFKQALTIQIQEKDRAGEAASLSELSHVLDNMERLEDAARCLQQSANIYLELRQPLKEGIIRGNLAQILIKLSRFDAARDHVMRALECKKTFGSSGEPWKTWLILAEIERASGHLAAADLAQEEAKKSQKQNLGG